MKWIPIAVLAVALLLGGWWLCQHYGLLTETVTLETGPGETQNLTLPDGTEVWLNEGSKLTYPVVFRGTQRQVELDGEGYFSVVKNEDLPFCIEADIVWVTVLGTAFNLRAYTKDRVAALTVDGGRVRFKPKQNRKSFVVNAGELCVFNKKSGKMQLLPISEPDSAPWRK